jgi:hypothetical protein
MTSWYPFETDGDPFPADPARVRTYGERVKETGELITEQITLLNRLADRDSWETEAADAFRDKAEDVAEKIERVKDRYIEVGGALTTFADAAESAYDDAIFWRNLARNAQATIDDNPLVAAPTGEDENGKPKELTPAQRSQNERRSGAEADLARYQGHFDEEVAAARSAASTAASAIEGAIDDEVEDDWWDKHRDAIMNAVKWLGRAALVLAVIIVIVGTGGIAGAILLGLAIAVGLASLVLNVGLAWKADGSWTAVVLDAVGLVTLGVGGLATRFATRAFAAGRSAVAASRGTSAFRQVVVSRMPLIRANRTLMRSPWSASLRQMGSDGMAAIRTEALQAARVASEAVTTTPAYNLGQRLLHGGTDAADTFTRSRTLLAELTSNGSRLTGALDDLARAGTLSGVATVANLGDLGVNITKGIIGTPDDVDGMSQGYVPAVAELISRIVR